MASRRNYWMTYTICMTEREVAAFKALPGPYEKCIDAAAVSKATGFNAHGLASSTLPALVFQGLVDRELIGGRSHYSKSLAGWRMRDA